MEYPYFHRWQAEHGWRVGSLPGAVQEQPLFRKLPVVERMQAAAVALGASGVLAHVGVTVSGHELFELDPSPEAHARHRQQRRELRQWFKDLFDPWPHTVDLAHGEQRGLHGHCTVPVEAVPGLSEWLQEARASGMRPDQLRVTRPRYILPNADRSIEFVRVVHNLPGLVEYTRCRPRLEVAKRSDHRRQLSHAEQMDAAEQWCKARAAALAAGRSRLPAASWSSGVPRLTAAERQDAECVKAERRARHVARLEAKRQNAERVTPLHVLAAVLVVLIADRQDADRTAHRAAVLASRRHQKGRAPLAAPRHCTVRRWPAAGRPVSRLHHARRLRQLGHARAPPRTRPRPRNGLPDLRGLSRRADLDLSPEASPRQPTTPPRQGDRKRETPCRTPPVQLAVPATPHRL